MNGSSTAAFACRHRPRRATSRCRTRSRAPVDPEEAYVAALSSCHMLFFLHLAGKRGFAVAAYEDQAFGEMAKRDDGREWIARVTLRPDVTFAGGKSPSPADIERLHHEAHDLCFLANSVLTEVLVDRPA
jgi:organic hydroperoxide reductase OsmC/OhrA